MCMLILCDYHHFPDTSRPRRDREVEGVDYHFISRPDFERAILNREFVEHGEFEKAYYGTSFNSIRDVVKKDKICVLNLHPLSLKLLKNSDLMPFVVFVAPPNLDQLRQKKRKLNVPFKVRPPVIVDNQFHNPIRADN